MHLVRLLASLLLGCLIFGCHHAGLVPQHPRVARAPEHTLELTGISQHALALEGGSTRIQVRLGALPAETQIRWVGIADAMLEACSKGYEALRVDVKDPQGRLVRSDQAKAGDNLSAVFSDDAARFMMSRASRLDLLLVDRHGFLKCAAFPLVDERPEHAFVPLDTWTSNTTLSMESLTRRIDGMVTLISFNLEFGRWIGPLRLLFVGGAGSAFCARDHCPAKVSDDKNREEVQNSKYYIPLGVGIGGVPFQWKSLAFATKAEYRLGFAAQETFGGLMRTTLHGPVVTPSLMWTTPDPIAPGIPGGLRRTWGLGIQAPLAYYMSTRGDKAFSWGLSLATSFPL